MVNLTYGILNSSGPTTPAEGLILPGSDIIWTNDDATIIASYNPGDIAWILTCTALVFLMIPGLGYLYSGLVRRKNALHMLIATMLTLAVIYFEWFFWGYSLTFTETGGPFFGNLKYFGFRGVLGEPAAAANNKLPAIVYAVYEQQFAALVPAIAIGAACERGRIWPMIPFTFVWGTLVYNVIAYDVWNPNGWAFKLGVLDYAGGGPVEIASGVTGLVYSLYLGKRKHWGTDRLQYAPHSVAHVFLGTVLLVFGWCGFNGGSTFAANLKAGMAVTTTLMAGVFGGVVWMIMDWRHFHRWSVVGFCTGLISGLVAITPAAGFVGVPASILIGAVAAAVSNLLTRLKIWFKFDDTLDIFSCHGISGMIGLLLTGIFAQSSVAANDGFLVIEGGWLDRHWMQVPYQLAWIAFATAWTAVGTFVIMFVIDHIPYCQFRTTDDGETCGLDEVECGEFAYDFVASGDRRDLEGNYLPSVRDSKQDEVGVTVQDSSADGNDRSSGEDISSEKNESRGRKRAMLEAGQAPRTGGL